MRHARLATSKFERHAPRKGINMKMRIVLHVLMGGILGFVLRAGAQESECPECEPDPCLADGICCVDELSNDELTDVIDFVEAGDDRPGTVGRRLRCPNLAAPMILSRLDIDGDGVPDGARDTDGDGLPDNWETGGVEALTAAGDVIDRVVFVPAPTAIVPGTPPTPVFTRLAVATSALDPDTDGDGLSDLIEVFGLKFIDEDGNGRLDANEWNDINGDGLPSPGEFPIDNSRTEIAGFDFLHDFDGFVFTDPTNRDTDGDGRSDGEDNDPLINPRSFGNVDPIIIRFNAEGVDDIDADGLGNGMDMGNDLVSEDGTGGVDFQVIDNPENIPDLLSLFRNDLRQEGVIPESQIEDLLGADWDGNGLWRTTDIRTWYGVIDESNPLLTPPAAVFTLDSDDPTSPKFYASQTFEDIQAVYADPGFEAYGGGVARRQGRSVGMGWQDLLRPNGRTEFLPDDRVWAILYSWRVPGFDVDGDGFIGVPNLSSTAPSGTNASGVGIASIGFNTTANNQLVLADNILVTSDREGDEAFDDRISFATVVLEQDDPELDGIIEPPPGFPNLASCGRLSAMILVAPLFMLFFLRQRRRS